MFGDATAPRIVSTTPADGAINVEPSTPIAIELTQVVEPINMTTVQILDGATPIPYAFTYNGTTLVLSPDIFLPGGHTIQVTLDGLVNTTALHVPLATTSFSFTTRDNVAPVLVLSDPLDHATAVPVTLASLPSSSDDLSAAMFDDPAEVELHDLERLTVGCVLGGRGGEIFRSHAQVHLDKGCGVRCIRRRRRGSGT